MTQQEKERLVQMLFTKFDELHELTTLLKKDRCKNMVEILPIQDISISLVRAKKYARHQHFLGTQGKELVEFEDWKQD